MKAVRLKLRCGEVRLAALTGNVGLTAWWNEVRALGFVAGNQWAVPFDQIALADLVELSDELAKQLTDGPTQGWPQGFHTAGVA